jgi:hypothetical protein
MPFFVPQPAMMMRLTRIGWRFSITAICQYKGKQISRRRQIRGPRRPKPAEMPPRMFLMIHSRSRVSSLNSVYNPCKLCKDAGEFIVVLVGVQRESKKRKKSLVREE